MLVLRAPEKDPASPWAPAGQPPVCLSTQRDAERERREGRRKRERGTGVTAHSASAAQLHPDPLYHRNFILSAGKVPLSPFKALL